MNQLSALFNRALLLCAVSVLLLLAASVCPAQHSATGTGQTGQPAAPEKDKSAAAVSQLDEELDETPGGKTVSKFFAAFNSGEIEVIYPIAEARGLSLLIGGTR
ncbi:MAG: hypothetical protein ACR2G4_09410 [Pyrinomonadaceae bacterium]